MAASLRSPLRLPAVLLAGAGLVLAGCFVDTQRLPGPMPGVVDPLPPGSLELYPPGPEQVLVIRHADPVQVRPAGMSSSFPMHFYRKQERVNAGSWVFSGAGGRLEVFWPDGATARFFGTATAIVGSPARGEASLIVRDVDKLSITLTEGRQIELVGGSVLVSDTGPFVVERIRPDILRIHNASKGVGRLAFREERIDLDPGNVLDLPLLPGGGDPVARPPGFQRVDTAGGPVEVRGDVDVEREEVGTRILVRGEHEVRGLGQRVRLGEGEELWIGPLGAPPEPEPEPAAAGQPAAEGAGDEPEPTAEPAAEPR